VWMLSDIIAGENLYVESEICEIELSVRAQWT
jgi:hypothetical protein